MRSQCYLLALATGALHATPPPTLSDVHYGPHERQVLDVWKADSAKPAPLVFFIHGGGWIFGDKNLVVGVEKYLAAGISVVSINYRYTSQAVAAGIAPPVKAPPEDAARALQFVRSKASEWNIDQTRVAASGRSAGACASLWLAFHADMADPLSSDPVARESTRLRCAAVVRAQTTLDPQQMREWTPNSDYGGHAFGFIDDPNDQFLPVREVQGSRRSRGAENQTPAVRQSGGRQTHRDRLPLAHRPPRPLLERHRQPRDQGRA
jgi:acetyl esterase/lipase